MADDDERDDDEFGKPLGLLSSVSAAGVLVAIYFGAFVIFALFAGR